MFCERQREGDASAAGDELIMCGGRINYWCAICAGYDSGEGVVVIGVFAELGETLSLAV